MYLAALRQTRALGQYRNFLLPAIAFIRPASQIGEHFFGRQQQYWPTMAWEQGQETGLLNSASTRREPDQSKQRPGPDCYS